MVEASLNDNGQHIGNVRYTEFSLIMSSTYSDEGKQQHEHHKQPLSSHLIKAYS